MRKLAILLAGFGLGLILIAGGFENSLAKEKSGVLQTDASSSSTEIPVLTYLIQQDADTIKTKSYEYFAKTNNQNVKKAKKFCFRGKPKPECNSFLITEFSYLYRFDKSPGEDLRHYLTWEFGGMVNRDEHSAIGATLFLCIDQDYDEPRIGLKTRYRRWLNPKTSLDIAPGILLSGWKKKFSFPSFTGHVGLNLADWFALSAQVEAIRWKRSGYDVSRVNGVTKFNRWEKVETDVSWYGGFKLGTPLGVAGGTVAVAIIALIAIGLSFSGGPMMGW